MIYLASPYSHPDKSVMFQRYQQVCRAAGALMKEGHIIYSPIAHNHSIAEWCDMPTTWDFWETYDTQVLALCQELWILQLEGWEQSTGVKAEHNFFLHRMGRRHNQISFITPRPEWLV